MEKYPIHPDERQASLSKLPALEAMNDNALDEAFTQNHDQVFSEFDCLTCANCCKTASPIIEQEDMDRMAEALNISRSALIQTYLEMDEDGDFVFQSTPCPMLQEDNRCKIYASRPEACRDYPHSRRKNMREVLDLIEPNSAICPALNKIIARINPV